MDKQIPNSEVFDVEILSTAMTVVCGRAVSKNIGAIVLSVDELFEEGEDHSVLALIDGSSVIGTVVGESCCAVAPMIGSYEDTLFLGDEGGVWLFSSGFFYELTTSLGGQNLRGPLRDIAADGFGNLLAVGSALQAYLSTDARNWAPAQLAVVESPAELAKHGLESIASFNGEEAYCVGWRGDVFNYKDGIWTRVALPTNLDFYAVSCAPDGFVYLCGDEGTIYKGRGDRWHLIDNEIADHKLWSVEQWSGRTFVAGDRMLYEIVDNQLEAARFADDDHPPTLTNSLSVGQDVLWSIGSKQMFQFDGESWEELFTLAGV